VQRPDRLKLADHVILARSGADVLFSSDVILKFPDCSPRCAELALSIRKGLTRAEIEAAAAEDSECAEMVHALTRLGFVVPEETNPWNGEPFAANFSYFAGIGLDPRAAQGALLDAHVVILGVGGTGTVVLQHLVGAGVGRFTLIDPDVVETKNLNRQFTFAKCDVGRAKVDAAADYVHTRLPDARVETRSYSVDRANNLEDLELSLPIAFFVNTADHPACEVLEAVAEYCGSRNVPFLGGGCGFLDGRYGPLVPPGGAPDYLRLQRLARARAAALGAVEEPLQPVSFAPLNTILGALMARDIIEYLAGGVPFSLGHSVWIDLRQTAISRTPACAEGED